MAVTFDTDSEILSHLVDAVTVCAINESGVPSLLAQEAAIVTLRNLKDVSESSASGYRRVHSYFWAVVRHRCLTSRDRNMAELQNRFITQTIRADASMVDRGITYADSLREVYSEVPCRVGETMPLPI